ncbi:hypothetical protein FAM09_19105 [Niastella caeni]|uniref:Fibronectin type III domain-containing protein n=1 Tax=Niastella caeni TaxID=2569763 RepID=A0A4S8HP37_9BACT|nr:hypothetical protein [Niastella caeni]THU37063.1 hypothetical protein FAM09_19105 [Niastella caeni]
MKKIKISRILFTFNYCRAGDLIKITRRIIDSMKQNANFPNPTPPLADVEKGLEEFLTALSNAGGFDRALVAIKDNKQAILKQLLTELAYYVTQTCKGDKALLLGSGFDINADSGKPQQEPPKLRVELGMPGQVTIGVKRIAKAKAYVHQYTADPLTPQSVWISETTLNPQHTFTGLTSAGRIWLRVIVIDRKGQSIFWDPVLRIVQ